MDTFAKEFIMELFLDNDSVSGMNRLVVAVANVVNENNENTSMFNEVLKKEYNCNEQVGSDSLSPGNSAIKHRIKCFYENTVLSYTDKEYVEKFKMKKSTVQALIDFLEDFIKPGIVPLDKKVHVFLWFLINDSSYNEIGALFDLHKSTVSYISHEIASLLCEQKYQFIRWPSTEEQHVTRIKVNSKFKFPNCIGFIDACRLKIGSKRNRKGKPEIILLQAVCDESLMFTHCHVGEVGKTRKSKEFRESNLSQVLKSYVDFENHILGDSEYKLKKNLITPFTSEELLTSEEMKFNEMHWKARSYIGHAFELLKERFRKLNYIDITKPESVNAIITAACVLHNFTLLQEGCSELKEESVMCDDGVTIDTNIVKNAVEKRQFLCNYINYIDCS